MCVCGSEGELCIGQSAKVSGTLAAEMMGEVRKNSPLPWGSELLLVSVVFLIGTELALNHETSVDHQLRGFSFVSFYFLVVLVWSLC